MGSLEGLACWSCNCMSSLSRQLPLHYQTSKRKLSSKSLKYWITTACRHERFTCSDLYVHLLVRTYCALLKALLENADVGSTQPRERCLTVFFTFFPFSREDFILDRRRSKCGCRGGGSWPITLGTKEEILLALPAACLWRTKRWGWKEGRKIKKKKEAGRRRASWQHPEVYSHVEWQLHLGMGQQLRGYRCHFGGHQYPCRGGRGTRVRRVLQTERITHTEPVSKVSNEIWRPGYYSKTHLNRVWLQPEEINIAGSNASLMYSYQNVKQFYSHWTVRAGETWLAQCTFRCDTCQWAEIKCFYLWVKAPTSLSNCMGAKPQCSVIMCQKLITQVYLIFYFAFVS